MTDRAAIMGSLVDVRNIGVHKSVKLTIHVPEELAVKVIDAFGWPTGVDPVPVAIARLNPEAKEVMPNEQFNSTPETAPAPADPPARAHKLWRDMNATQQAAIRCNEVAFQKYLQEMYRARWKILSGTDAEKAAELTRVLCDVQSRRDIRSNTDALDKWCELDDEYRAWLRVLA